jgi:hypothetical protein
MATPMKVLLVTMLAVLATAGAANAATMAKPSAFVAGYEFCQAFDTRTLAMRFDTKPTKTAVSNQVGRWFTWRIPRDHPAYRYPTRYQRIIAAGCARGL